MSFRIHIVIAIYKIHTYAYTIIHKHDYYLWRIALFRSCSACEADSSFRSHSRFWFSAAQLAIAWLTQWNENAGTEQPTFCVRSSVTLLSQIMFPRSEIRLHRRIRSVFEPRKIVHVNDACPSMWIPNGIFA